MADHQSGGETIRQMLAGFNAMQMQLGLLPMPSAQTPMGVGFQPPPPPPQVPHPSEAAAQAIAQQQEAMRQTMQAAQMTRYLPPPSTPIGGSGAFTLNPYVAGAMGGGAGGALAMPSPMSMTAPAYAGYRPLPGFSVPHIGQGPIPAIFNPFAPSVSPAHFMTPAMQSVQIMQGMQARGAGMAAGLIDGAFSTGGSLIGGALGSAFGPLGSLAGSFLGQKVGGFLGGLGLTPGLADAARGRQLQNMTAPWLVSGTMLNPYTGQGLDREAARATATGLRHLATRDYDFQRTGYNTEDVMKITQLAGDQGLLRVAQSPDDIVRKVKEISKAVKTLVQVTGDPDIRNAIAALGQMKDLGFLGTAGQAGAVANRAMFARMAGVSQASMHEVFGMPGAMLAQQTGLVGATGYMAGMTGGAMANIARSSGALNSMQMARAGGAQGLAQINTMAQLGGVNQDLYMAAALTRGAKGIDVDIDAYRRAQGMTVSEVSALAANNLRDLGKEGIFELRTRKQEFKDKLAQQMSPFEASLNVVRQARGLQKQVPGMNFGSALFATARSSALGAGMSDEQAEAAARSLELQFSNPDYFNGLEQQLKAQRRQLADRARAERAQYRTPGVLTQWERGIRSQFQGISDSLSAPFRALDERMERAAEEQSAMYRGERLFRTGRSALIQSSADQALAMGALHSDVFRSASGSLDFSNGNGRALLGASLANPMMAPAAILSSPFLDRDVGNRVTSFLGLSRTNDRNRINEIAHATYGHAFGNRMFESFGSAQASLRRVEDVASVGQAMTFAGTLTNAKRTDIGDSLRSKGIDVSRVLLEASDRLHRRVAVAGSDYLGIDSAEAMSGSQVKESIIESLMHVHKMSAADAEKFYEANKQNLTGMVIDQVGGWAGKGVRETMAKAKDAEEALGGINGASTPAAINRRIKELAKASGISGGHLAAVNMGAIGWMRGRSKSFSETQLTSLKHLVTGNSADAVKLASLQLARGNARSTALKNAAQKAIEDMRSSFKGTDKEFQALMQQASDITRGSSPEARQALTDLSETALFHGKDYKGISEQFGSLKDYFGATMGKSALDYGKQRLSDITGRKDVTGMSMDDMFKISMTDDQLNDARLGSAAQRALFRKARAGDVKAQEEWLTATAAKSEKELLGGGSGGSLRALDEQIANVQQLKEEVAAEGGDKATQLFAEGSTMLAEAAKDLKVATENMRLAQNAPLLQRLFGGG